MQFLLIFERYEVNGNYKHCDFVHGEMKGENDRCPLVNFRYDDDSQKTL